MQRRRLAKRWGEMMGPQFEGERGVKAIIVKARSEGRSFLMEHESKEVLRAYGIPTNRGRLASSASESAESAEEIGFPVVLKVHSPDIIHKSDCGGVIIGLRTSSEVEEAYRRIVKNVSERRPQAKILGVLVQEMVPKGYEVIVGAVRDAQFGPAVMFGLGGVFVELYDDVSFRLAPLSKKEALRMIKETKGFKLLEGLRGEEPADLDALAEVIVKVGEIMVDLHEVTEIDINPLIIYDRGLVAVDARMILSQPF